MTGKSFHIIVFKDKLLLNWGTQQGIPYRIASGLEKDRLIARILHKILNLRLSTDGGGVLGKAEFQVLGDTLFKLLFNDEALHMQFVTFYREALASTQERYRLVLEFAKEADELALLPWEYLSYQEANSEVFLAAHPQRCVDVVRKLPFQGNWLELDKTASVIAAPLQVLILAANPDSEHFIPHLNQSIAYFESLEQRFPEKINVEIIVQPEVHLLEQQLEQATQNGTFFPHILHFIGRARMDGDNGQLCFVKRTADGKYAENWISDDTFAGFFEEWRRLPHLVVLDCCDSTPIGSYRDDKGVAMRLVKRGVPFVLALQNPTPEWMAQLLVEKFYEALLQGADVAHALTEARFFLARKLVDASGRKYDNYEHKVFGSPALFTSVLQPFALAQTSTPSPAPVPLSTLRVCPNHPQVKFLPGETRCSLCGALLLLPEQLAAQKTESPRTPEVPMLETTGVATTTGRVTADPGLRSASPQRDPLTTAGSSTTATTSIENVKLTSIKRYFKKLISNELEIAFQEIETILAMEANDASNRFYTLLGDFNTFNREKNANILDEKDAAIRENKVRYLLIEFVDGIKVLDIEGAYFANFNKG